MKPERTIYLILLIFFLVFAVLTFFLAVPLIKKISTFSQELVSLEKELRLLQVRKNELEKLQSEDAHFKENFAQIQQLFVNPENPIQFMNFLESNASELNLKIETSFPPLKEEEKGFLRIRLDLLGSYPHFCAFLERLENAPYLLEIEQLTVDKFSEDELKKEDYKDYTINDVRVILTIKALTKTNEQDKD